MPTTAMPDELLAELQKPHPCVVATVRPDGELHTAATWYGVTDDGDILLNMDAGRARLRHLRLDPRVALTMFAGENWYSHISLAGSVTEMYEDHGLADIDRLSRHYDGREYPDRDRPRWSAIVAVARWHAWGAFGGA